MNIRKAVPGDLPELLTLYAYAREQMRKNGNPNQWGTAFPPQALIAADIDGGIYYILEENSTLAGAFTFFLGEEPDYRIIADGAWRNASPYGVIHRVAGNGTCRGLLHTIIAFCDPQIDNLRMDTHADNRIMQHLLEKEGFVRCGTVFMHDGSSRLAYHRIRT